MFIGCCFNAFVHLCSYHILIFDILALAPLQFSYLHYQSLQVSCPGTQLIDFPNADTCRLLALRDGTVVNQSPVSKPLCMRAVIQSSKLKIAKDYADGEGMYKKSASIYGVAGKIFVKNARKFNPKWKRKHLESLIVK